MGRGQLVSTGLEKVPTGLNESGMISHRTISKPISQKPLRTKGQIISECPYEIIVCPKIATKKFPRFLPWPLRRGQIKNFIKPIMLNNP